ncbi:MAG TPA: hypothetical protein VF092_04625 [Longimicrobium sp.]
MKEYDPHPQQAPPSLDDDERIAALLDGRLDEHARAELVARLADSDSDYRVFADAAAVLRDLEARGVIATPPVVADESPEAGEAVEAAHPAEPMPAPAPGPTKVIKLRRRWWGMPAPAWGALAAGIAALALIPIIRARGGDPFDPERLAARLETSQPRAGEWTAADSVIPRKRGGGPGSEISEEARSAQLGALLVDLEVAARSRDTMVSTLAGDVARLVRMGREARDTMTYDSIAKRSNAPPEQLRPLLAQGHKGIAENSDPDYFRAGAWTEAARLAANTRDERFFRARESRKGVERILAIQGLPKDQAADAAEVRDALPEAGTPDWPVLRRTLRTLLENLVKTSDPMEPYLDPQASVAGESNEVTEGLLQ